MLKIIEKLSTLLGSHTGKEPKTILQDKEPSSDRINLSMLKPIEGTPFCTALKEKNKYVIVMGQHLITNETFYSRGAAEKFVKQTDWWTILNVVGVYVENYFNEKISQLKNSQ